MKRIRPILVLIAVALVAIIAIGCGSNADTVNENIKKECDQFHCLRNIVGINGITDKVEFEVTGLCSIQRDGDLIVTCKEPGDDGKPVFKKHYLGLSDNVFWINTQLQGLDVSQYRTKIIFRPTAIVPDFDLATGDGG